MKSRNKIYVWALATVLFCIVLALGINRNVKADVGEAPTSGGTIIPGDKTDKVEMTYEKVVYDIKVLDKDSPFYRGEDYSTWLEHYAHVTAEFKMTNTSTSAESMDLMFPIPCAYPILEYFEPDNEGNQSLNFEVTIDGEEVDFDYAVYNMESFKESPDYEDQQVMVIEFPAEFGAKQETLITIEYDARLVFEPKSIYGTFHYILETGSHWKGNIRAVEVIFDFPTNITDAVFSSYNEEFEISKDKLVWEFQDLEPDSSSNVEVTYAPSLLTGWEGRETSIEEISSYGDTNYIYDDSYLPSGYTFGFAYTKEGSAVFLLGSMEDDLDSGWLANLGGDANPWVQFDFDAVYEVDSMTIIPAILQTGVSSADSSYKDFYDLFSRPKGLRLTFSDGTSQDVTLTDSQDEAQTVEFNKVETSSVKVEVVSTYTDFAGNDMVLGIARMDFGIGQKVREKGIVEEVVDDTQAEGEEQTSGESESWMQLSTGVLVLAFCCGGTLVLGLGSVGLVILRRAKRRKAKKKALAGKTQESNEIKVKVEDK